MTLEGARGSPWDHPGAPLGPDLVKHQKDHFFGLSFWITFGQVWSIVGVVFYHFCNTFLGRVSGSSGSHDGQHRSGPGRQNMPKPLDCCSKTEFDHSQKKHYGSGSRTPSKRFRLRFQAILGPFGHHFATQFCHRLQDLENEESGSLSTSRRHILWPKAGLIINRRDIKR